MDHLVARALSSSAAVGAEGAVVLPALGSTAPPGRLGGDHLHVSGLATARILRQDVTLIATGTPSGVIGVTLRTADLTLHPVRGLDPDLGLVEVTGEITGVDRGAAPGVAWEPAVAIAQLAIGHELVGASRTMLELARTHALERIQFGQPIAAFQAVRHRLADTFVAIESTEALLSARRGTTVRR